jgi:hypothetical protein
MPPLPDAHFGPVEDQTDELPEIGDDEEAEEDAPADPALVAILGFDPDEEK